MPPNILFITTDQQRWDTIGCSGNQLIQTPNLDRLALSGIRFERAYCESPICIPSRITIITGRKASHHGATLHNSNMRPDERTLAHVFTETGYRTHFIGKAHFRSQELCGTEESLPDWREGKFAGWNGPYAGFQTVDLVLGHSNPLLGHFGKWLRDNYPGELRHFMLEEMQPLEVTCGQGVYQNNIPPGMHSSAYIAMRTNEFLATAAETQDPFLCWASFPDPHWPICPPSPYFEMYDTTAIPEQSGFPQDLDGYPRQFRKVAQGQPTGYDGGGHRVQDESDIARITRPYWGSISFIDQQVGCILDQLDQTGLVDNTIILFTSDHGEHMGAHGLMAKGGFMYEEFIRCPLLISFPGVIPAGMVSQALFSFTDFVPTLGSLLGISLDGMSPDGISMSDVLKGVDGSKREQLTVTHFGSGSPDQAPDIHCMVTQDWKLNYYAGDKNGELYHLAGDPEEAHNLYNNPEYKHIQDDLTGRLLDELILVNDRRAHEERKSVVQGYANHSMVYDFWRDEFDALRGD